MQCRGRAVCLEAAVAGKGAGGSTTLRKEPALVTAGRCGTRVPCTHSVRGQCTLPNQPAQRRVDPKAAPHLAIVCAGQESATWHAAGGARARLRGRWEATAAVAAGGSRPGARAAGAGLMDAGRSCGCD